MIKSHKLVKKIHWTVNLGNKNSQISEKRHKKCKFRWQKVAKWCKKYKYSNLGNKKLQTSLKIQKCKFKW